MAFMFYLYVLKSKKDLGYYIGSTNNTIERLSMHNAGRVKSTKPRIPFILAHVENFLTRSEALKREIHLKKNYRAREDLFESIGFKNL